MTLGNELFIRAIQWLYEHEGVNGQKELSELTGITETTLSRIMNDKVQKPSIITIQKLMKAFPGIFNPTYFSGQSIYMLMEDYLDAQDDDGKVEQPSNQSKDASIAISALNKTIDAQKETIESLKREIATKDMLIESLRQQLTTSNIQAGNYPFTPGVAEDMKIQPNI